MHRTNMFPHVSSGPGFLVGAVLPSTNNMMRDVNSDEMRLNGLQIVELSLTADPPAFEDLVVRCWTVVDGHFNARLTLRGSTGSPFGGCHSSWRGGNDDKRLR